MLVPIYQIARRHIAENRIVSLTLDRLGPDPSRRYPVSYVMSRYSASHSSRMEFARCDVIKPTVYAFPAGSGDVFNFACD